MHLRKLLKQNYELAFGMKKKQNSRMFGYKRSAVKLTKTDFIGITRKGTFLINCLRTKYIAKRISSPIISRNSSNLFNEIFPSSRSISDEKVL